MAIQATIRLRHRGCVTESFTGKTSLAQISGERGWDVFVLHAGDSRALAEALRACEEFAENEAEIVSRSGTSVVFRGRNPPGGVIATIRQSVCSILWPVVYRDRLEHYTILAPSREALSALVDALGEHGDVSLVRVAEVAADGLDTLVPLGDLTATLTERQLHVLAAAVAAGYYESPRRATTAELADRFGVSASTLKEHLRKAEARVLERVGTLLSDRPTLARGATRRPGRPRRPPGSG